MDVYNQAMADAQESYANGSFLGDAYAKTQDNIASKLEIISNKIKMLQDSFGEALLPILAPILDGITKFLDGLNAIANNPIGKWAIVVGSSLIAMLTAFTSVKMISMKATASLLAFRTAQMSLSKIGQDNTGIVGFFNALTGREKLIIRSNGRIEVSTRNAIKQMVKMGEIRIAKRGSEEDKALSRGHDARRAGMASTDALYAERDARKQATLTSNEDTIATLSNGEAKRANSAATKENASASNAEVTAKNASVLAVQQEIIAIDAEIGAKQARLTVLASERAAMS
ncbi:MAG: hypothetical protein EBT70_17095, partial [Betaproteobacteria bacterium]|nr:hypothetical protein [Betaproteobacteria bacterium]